MSRYGMGRFEAYDRAFRALEKYEARRRQEEALPKGPPRSPSWLQAQTHKHRSGYNPDYVQDCTGTESCACHLIVKPTGRCAQLEACEGVQGGCGCPPPLANSSEVSEGCTTTCGCGDFLPGVCPERANCVCGGTCGYDCDAPYVWDPVGETCVLPVGEFLGDGIVMTKG